MQSERVINVLGLSNRYRVKPSTILGIEDDYTAFCFDEACLFIIQRIEDGEEPIFKIGKKSYNSFSEMYKDIGF